MKNGETVTLKQNVWKGHPMLEVHVGDSYPLNMGVAKWTKVVQAIKSEGGLDKIIAFVATNTTDAELAQAA